MTTMQFNYIQRFLLTFIGAVTVGLLLSYVFQMPLSRALLVATPGCLMVGSMFVLWHLAIQGKEVGAKEQLAMLLVVEFLLVPLGATAALVAFFVLRGAGA
ncbi:MAG: hypothetical protein AAGJ46_18760 [Planctomycetota bacterium]